MKLIILCLIGYSLCVSNFVLHLNAGEELCLDEYFSDKTLVIYEIATDKNNVNVKIYDSSDKIVYSQVIEILIRMVLLGLKNRLQLSMEDIIRHVFGTKIMTPR
jgi:hypothetical protein